MPVIDLNGMELRDLISYLEYAKNEKELEEIPTGRNHFTTRNYDINRIQQLIDRLSGKTKKDYLVQTDVYKQELNTKRDYYDSEQAKKRYKTEKEIGRLHI